jgi:hypothetical protein
MTPAERATLNEKLSHLNDALFDYDKATIRDDASTVLKSDVGVIRDILANYPNQKLLIEGNADERGSEEYNLALGDRRARAPIKPRIAGSATAALTSLPRPRFSPIFFILPDSLPPFPAPAGQGGFFV